MAEVTSLKSTTSSMDSSFPVLVPEDAGLFMSTTDFGKYIHELLKGCSNASGKTGTEEDLKRLVLDGSKHGERFMNALHDAVATAKVPELPKHLADKNMMFTENMDIAHKTTGSALLDLFSEAEKTVDGNRLEELLSAAWTENPTATLKIIWNVRSIHLGKAERETFYKCLGWMKEQHPRTVLVNLPWLYRSIIDKKVKKEDDEAAVIIDRNDLQMDEPDVLHGVSHGYWKDLLNVLALAARGCLTATADTYAMFHSQKTPSRKREPKRAYSSLYPEQFHSKRGRSKQDDPKQGDSKQAAKEQTAKELRHELERTRHQAFLEMFGDPFYRSLHLTVARLFADQLKKDKELLSGDRKAIAKISLAAKWAPSLGSFHDKYSFIASSIAEILYPPSSFIEHGTEPREMYLKRARESYRRLTLSPLRKALEIVERDISANTFDNIKYARVPSLAMDRYKKLFVQKDLEHFEKYIEKVAAGKARISGAVLSPATLVKQTGVFQHSTSKLKSVQKLVLDKVLDGQWKTLCQRIKDNGTLASSIAVCDVSGSMGSPKFEDGTCPLFTAIGLSLLMAEVVEPPFGGSFISFSSDPKVHDVGGSSDTRSFNDKVSYITKSMWSATTDFVAVFERLLLPMALTHQLKQEDMVKNIFVFSDMQFDDAQGSSNAETSPWVQFDDAQGWSNEETTASPWETSFQRIKRKYNEAGYELPRLIFWNLAGGKHDYGASGHNAPKAVTNDDLNTVMVSGYSQAMLKVFLENGQFGADDEEEVAEILDNDVADEDFVEVKKEKKKKKADPMAMVWKTIGHKAYDPLVVVD